MTDTSGLRVPTFSLPELKKGEGKEEFRAWVTKAGFFYLTDCGVREQDHRLATDTAMEFFAQGTPEEKQAMRAKNPTMRRGFSALEAESTAQVTKTGTYTDYSMSFSMGIDDNLFPSDRFEKVWTDYFTGLHTAALDAARIVMEAAGTYDGPGEGTGEGPGDGHGGGTHGGAGHRDSDVLLDTAPVLRLRYFPEVPEHRVAEHEPRRMAPHYDLSLVTLIHQTPCANGFVSLQAEMDGRMVDLPHVPDAVVVLCGAVAPLVTRGAVPAPRHHVRSPESGLREGSARTSSVFFLRPSTEFGFSVPKAREYGLEVDTLDGETATFGDWIGTNYVTMHATPAS
ncbi:2OG-Fe(II) oxygenase family protein [Streptomyces sp. NPDC046203]|uniref:2OG-Fe(II) oxygenase family protein n=1 Tax=Streptomyces sp. NPDC046203 TaxID=3154602 RepID=UPI0033F2C2AB